MLDVSCIVDHTIYTIGYGHSFIAREVARVGWTLLLHVIVVYRLLDL